jgi:hypothetical protein
MLALSVTIGIYRADRSSWRWWYLSPAIFCLKLAWCWGAAAGIR